MSEAFVLFSFAFLFILVNMMVKDQISKFFILSYQILWFIVLSLSLFSPYGLYKPSHLTYLLLCINVISFSVGFLSVRVQQRERYSINSTKLNGYILQTLKNKFFISYIIFITAYEIYLLTKFFARLALATSLAEVRYDFYYDNFYGESFNFMNLVFLWPTFYITLPLFVYCLFYYRKPICIILLLYILIYCNLGGGRLDYITIFYTICLFTFCLQKISKRKIKIILSIAIVLFTIISGITSSRLSSDSRDISFKELIIEGMDDTVESIISYTCGASVALDYAIYNDYAHKIGGYQYGKVTGSGLLQLINIFSKRIGLQFDEPMTRLLEYKQERYIRVSKTRSFNALYTAVLYFYLDFGPLGVLFFPFLFGVLVRKLIRKFYFYQSISLLILLNFAYISSLMTITDLRGFAVFSCILFIIILYKIGISKYSRIILYRKS